MENLTLHDFESRVDRPIQMKVPEFNSGNRLKHVIFTQQFSRKLLESLAKTALRIKSTASSKEGNDFLSSLLSHKRAMFYFTQVSTRTFLSFMAASQILGIKCNEIRDPSLSSEFKGEHPVDSIRMFSSFFDVIIMRSRIPNFAESCAYLMNDLDDFNHRSVPIINGGAGADEHPTQALLDYFTIQRSFAFSSMKDSTRWNRFRELRKTFPGLKKGLDGKVYGFCGDLRRGRTVRSLTNLLALYSGVSFVFISPEDDSFRFPEDEKRRLEERGVSVYEEHSLEKVIKDVDLLYMTRVQHEYNKSESMKSEIERRFQDFVLTPDLLRLMKEYAPIMHPFPRNKEVPVEIDSDPRAMYFRQARNGMWVRAALIAHLFDVDHDIAEYFSDCFSEYHNYNAEVV